MEAKQPEAPVVPAKVQRPVAKFLRGFVFAYAGIKYCFKTQRNFRVHTGISIFAILLGLYLGMTWQEWALLATVITLVLAAEMVNTMVESLVDLVTQEYHPLAKVAKDVSAGVVLLTALGALIVGILIFSPKIWALFGW